MAQVNFQQGEDIIVELAILSAGTPVDLTDSTLRVQLYVTKSNVKNLFFKYSDTPKSGYGTCRQKTGMGNTNIIQVLITRAQSVNFDIGTLGFAAIVTDTNADFPEGFNTEYDFDNYGTVQAGEAKDEVIP